MIANSVLRPSSSILNVAEIKRLSMRIFLFFACAQSSKSSPLRMDPVAIIWVTKTQFDHSNNADVLNIARYQQITKSKWCHPPITTVERLKKEKNALERAILVHYERLNQALAAGANESSFADIQDQIREKEQRVSEVVDEMAAVSSLFINESDVRDALGRFQEVWAALSPAERAKAIHQIVDSIQYDGHSKELSISYHPIGIRTFSQEQQSKEGAETC